ncbi:MAG: phosphatase PAP2 family protein [Pseudonocardiales bacterium]|nr:phosphatase PAP2 family protein [Pseudonocardiales bacterium]
MVTTSATSELVAAEPDAYPPLLPAHLRRPAVVIIVLALLLLAVLALRYAHQEAAGTLDRTLDSYIRTRLRSDQSMTGAVISFVYSPRSLLVLAVVAVIGAVARRWSGVILTLGGPLIAVTITEVILKPLTGRLRYGHLTFPSGHATVLAATAIAIIILLAGAKRPRSVVLRLTAALATAAVAAGVAISLIAQHIHYTTDTIAGCCVAVVTVLSLALALDFVPRRVEAGRSGI